MAESTKEASQEEETTVSTKQAGRTDNRVRIEFNRSELIHLRRFLNRAVDCCEGKCREYRIPCWYYCKPLIEKISKALKKIEERS